MGYELSPEYLAAKPYPALLDEILKRALELRIDAEEVEGIQKLIERGRIAKVKKKAVDPSLIEEGVIVSGVDGGHYGKECEGVYIGVMGGLSYTSSIKEVVDPEPASTGSLFLAYVSGEEGSRWLGLLERMLTLRVAINTILKRRPKWMLIDGGLLIWPLYFMYDVPNVKEEVSGLSYAETKGKFLEAMIMLLEISERECVNLVGIVKNPNSKLLDNLGRLKDVAILNRLLKVGESTVDPKDPGDHPTLDYYEGQRRTISNRLRGTLSDRRIDRNFFTISYIKTTPLKCPIRLELPPWVDLDEAAALVMKTADPISGIPLHILKADRLVKVSEDAFKSIYSKVLYGNPNVADLLRPVRGEEFIIKEKEWWAMRK